MQKIIVYDSDHHGALKNRCFEDSYATEGPGHSFTVDLGKAARSRGFGIMTADVFLSQPRDANTTVFMFTEMVSKNTDLLLQRGAVPLICFSLESPLIAKDFYINIKKLSGRFIYSMQFRGTRDRLEQTSTQFSVMYFPVESRAALPYQNWKDRLYIVLINRNKRAFYSDASSLNGMVRSILSRIKFKIQKAIDPWIRSKEIYKDRIEAIHFFSKHDDFHLYGGGWENPIPGFTKPYADAAKKAFRGGLAFDEKLRVMNGFRFAICFENCSFPGYITEKIFDCFLAGCIPVYYGAPDIADFVPADSFVDYRNFADFEALDTYLKKMPDAQAFKMLESARQFLAGRDFDKYYSKNVIDDMLNKAAQYE